MIRWISVKVCTFGKVDSRFPENKFLRTLAMTFSLMSSWSLQVYCFREIPGPLLDGLQLLVADKPSRFWCILILNRANFVQTSQRCVWMTLMIPWLFLLYINAGGICRTTLKMDIRGPQRMKPLLITWSSFGATMSSTVPNVELVRWITMQFKLKDLVSMLNISS